MISFRYVLYLSFLFFIPIAAAAQAVDSVASIKELQIKIDESRYGERLKWLDSLLTLVHFKDQYDYDSIATETIQYALTLDSFNIAAKHTSNLIYYKSYIHGKTEEALLQFKAFLKHVDNVSSEDSLKTMLFNRAAVSYTMSGKPDSALVIFNMAEEYALKSGSERLLGVVLVGKGNASGRIGEFSEPSVLYRRALTIFLETNDIYNIITVKNNLAILYSQNAFYQEAQKERQEAIELSLKHDEKDVLAWLYYNSAADYRMMGEEKKRIHHLRQAIAYNTGEYKLQFEPVLLCDLVIALAENDSLQEAEKYFSVFEGKPERHTMDEQRYVEMLKQLALAKGDLESSLIYAKKHLQLAVTHKAFVEIMNAEKFLADVYDGIGDQRYAQQHLLNYYHIKDSLSSIQNVKSLTYYQTLYETEKRDHQIEAQKNDIELLASENRSKNQLMLFGGVGLLGVFSIVVLIRKRNAARNKQQMLENFSRELINAQEGERTRVARELHDGVGQRLTLLTRKIKATGNTDLSHFSSGIMEELRDISRGLYPVTIESFGVTSAIKAMIDEIDAYSDIFFTYEIDDVDKYMNRVNALHYYRIIQELLNNIVKHAEARAVFIDIKVKTRNIETTIRDNGKGVEYFKKYPKSSSIGMKTLVERAKILGSDFRIDAKPTKGTSVNLTIACP
ncbi:MAG: histidine kinase [Pseudomonadota bacterium]